MSKSGEKDELVPLKPNSKSEYMNLDLKNTQMDEENGATDMGKIFLI